ncbi:MAG: AAA family ATPase [Planctomycetota bacterium]|nr:AAA family ATPase [Planctomycetota bacterium]
MICERIEALGCGAHPLGEVDAEKAAAWAQERLGFAFARGQSFALKMAISEKFCVITGGPGVGKTTILRACMAVFRAKRLNVALAAPTGRAAKRMSESTGAEALTIHRLLEYDPSIGRFRRDSHECLDADVVVVDEASMLDVELAASLLLAVREDAAVLLVGDADQLPSVGPGRVLWDIIESGRVPCAELTEVFRQSRESTIVTNAHRINSGEMPYWPRGKVDRPQDNDFYFFTADEPEQAREILVDLVSKRIPDEFGFNAMEDIQVITPMQRGELGAVKLNESLKAAINPKPASLTKYGRDYSIGDKVMQVVNDYDKNVFNGDIGRIQGIDEKESRITVMFDKELVNYEYSELDELVPSYAITIHKSQGSEYPCVVIALHTTHYIMLQRNLIYTAVTRAKKLCVIVGNTRALGRAVSNTDSSRRITRLKGLLEQTIRKQRAAP